MIRRLLRAHVLLLLPVALVAGACSERLDTAAGCPALCPGQQLDILDTLLDPAIVLDTTLTGFPFVGFESPLLLVNRGDTLDVRTVIRFDSLARRYNVTADSTRPVEMVDSVTLAIRLSKTRLRLPLNFFIDAYEVTDTLLPDTIPQTLLPLFTPQRLLGSVQVDSTTFTRDTMTVRIRLDTAVVRSIVTSSGVFLRIGLRMRSTESGAVLIAASDDATAGPQLRYRVSADTAIPAANIRPLSLTPRVPLNLNGDLPDYIIVADAPDPRAAGRFAIGGLPASRSYLRFDLPRWLTDSVAVIRAQLELTQDPVRGVDETDTLVVRAQLVLAGHATTDLNRAARLLAPAGFFVGDSLVLVPGDSGVKRLEINALLRAWRTVEGRTTIPTAIVLKTETEGSDHLAARFFGVNAPVGLRPRLRLSYVPSIRFGTP